MFINQNMLMVSKYTKMTKNPTIITTTETPLKIPLSEHSQHNVYSKTHLLTHPLIFIPSQTPLQKKSTQHKA